MAAAVALATWDEGAAVEGVLLRNSRDANGGGGAKTSRAGADLADSFNGLVGPGPIEKVF